MKAGDITDDYHSKCPYCEDLKKMDSYAIAHMNFILTTICKNCDKEYSIGPKP